jgi:hypothetical protein
MAIPPKEVSTAATLEPFITSGLAACTASACIHPIDLAKGICKLVHLFMFNLLQY